MKEGAAAPSSGRNTIGEHPDDVVEIHPRKPLRRRSAGPGHRAAMAGSLAHPENLHGSHGPALHTRATRLVLSQTAALLECWRDPRGGLNVRSVAARRQWIAENLSGTPGPPIQYRCPAPGKPSLRPRAVRHPSISAPHPA